LASGEERVLKNIVYYETIKREPKIRGGYLKINAEKRGTEKNKLTKKQFSTSYSADCETQAR
jgi:hypothetical protein